MMHTLIEIRAFITLLFHSTEIQTGYSNSQIFLRFDIVNIIIRLCPINLSYSELIFNIFYLQRLIFILPSFRQFETRQSVPAYLLYEKALNPVEYVSKNTGSEFQIEFGT